MDVTVHDVPTTRPRLRGVRKEGTSYRYGVRRVDVETHRNPTHKLRGPIPVIALVLLRSGSSSETSERDTLGSGLCVGLPTHF